MTQLIIIIISCCAAFIILGFLLSRLLNRNDVADGMWGLGFVGIAWASYILFEPRNLKSCLVLALVSIWGLRLSIYLWLRLLPKSEDIRYVKMKQKWKEREWFHAFIRVFLLQGTILGLVSLPLVWVMREGATSVTFFDFIGLSLFIIGFLFELVADWELTKFKKENREGILNSGVWAYCRHPNYFGEILIWWGFFFFALGEPLGGITIISPLLMTGLLLKVSGAPMLDEILKKKGAAFSKYVESTPSTFPFSVSTFISFLLLTIVLLALDHLWLGTVMTQFYLSHATSYFRVMNENWDPIIWAVVGVYFFIALGIYYFAVFRVDSLAQSFFKGAVFGFVTYGIYEFTNLALVKDWPVEMALVDLLWGPILCGGSALIVAVINRKLGLTA